MSHLHCQCLIVLTLILPILFCSVESNDFNENAIVEKLLSTGTFDDQINCLDIGLEYLLNKRGYNITNEEQTEHYCRLREFPLIPQYLWNFMAGGMCIFHTPRQRFHKPFPWFTCNYLSSNGVNYGINLTVINKTIVFFDYTNQADLPLIKTLFRPDQATAHLQRFVECAEEADYCCSSFMNEENVAQTEENPCPAVWDAWSCFPPAQPGTTAKVMCPPHSYSSNIPCIEFSERYCLEEGGWNPITNHLICTVAGMARRRISFYIIALIVSSAICIPAIIIYFIMRKISLRIILHRNLLVAVVVKNILTILSNWIVLWDNVDPTIEREPLQGTILEESPGWCKFLAYLENVSINFIFTWMLMEAFYLHKTIVRVFSKDPNIIAIYIFVIVSSIIPSTVWAILMASADRGYCWMVDFETSYQWITDGYRLAILIINTLLLLDIIRVFVLKISQHATLDQIKSSIKVILFLTLLFGVPLIIISQRDLMNTEYCSTAMIYYFVMYSVEALQGVIIAVLFCYLNKEVHKQLRHKWQMLTISVCGHRFASRRSTAKTILTKDQLSSSFGNETVINAEKK